MVFSREVYKRIKFKKKMNCQQTEVFSKLIVFMCLSLYNKYKNHIHGQLSS